MARRAAEPHWLLSSSGVDRVLAHKLEHASPLALGDVSEDTHVRVCDILSASSLPVCSEDDVLHAVSSLVSLGYPHASVWRTVRFSYLSPHGCGLLADALAGTSAHSPRRDPSDFSIPIPEALSSYIARQLLLRTQRQAAAGGVTGPGSLALPELFEDVLRLHSASGYASPAGRSEVPGDSSPLPRRDPAALQAALGARALVPRHAYSFSTDVHGVSYLGAGLGMFFVWVDPTSPLRNNCTSTMPHVIRARGETHPLPDKYIDNIRAWANVHHRPALVFNGLQCALAVREASYHPEFRPASAAHTPDSGGRSRSSTSPDGSDSTTSLWETYLHFARMPGGWIRCVDIARMAIAWLCGSGTTYIDTDMKPATHELPLAFVVPRLPCSAVVSRPSDADEATAPDLPRAAGCTALPTLPLLLIPQDADGTLQNNLLATTTAFHPLLTLCLRAVVVSSVHEGHVIHSTGPAMITSVFYAYRNARITGSPALVWLEDVPPDSKGLHEPAPAPVLPIRDTIYETTRAALPVPLPDAVFPFLRRIPEARHGPHAPRHESPKDKAPPGWLAIDHYFLADTVHVAPPSAFFPKHWRVPADASMSAGAAADLDKAAAATKPASDRPGTDPARLSSARPGSFWRPTLSPVSESARARRVAAMLEERRINAGRGRARVPSPLSFGFTAADVRAAGAAAKPGTHAERSDTTIRFGEHAWDCTWAPAVGGGYSTSMAYGYAAYTQPAASDARPRAPRAGSLPVLEASPRSERFRAYMGEYVHAAAAEHDPSWAPPEASESSVEPAADPFGGRASHTADKYADSSEGDVFRVADLASRVTDRLSARGW